MVTHRRLVFHALLVDVVTVLAQSLPVGSIPKQSHVPPVGNPMVDQGSQARAATPL
jgi:hypothetical protein